MTMQESNSARDGAPPPVRAEGLQGPNGSDPPGGIRPPDHDHPALSVDVNADVRVEAGLTFSRRQLLAALGATGAVVAWLLSRLV
jgi:hypothetical protein